MASKINNKGLVINPGVGPVLNVGESCKLGTSGNVKIEPYIVLHEVLQKPVYLQSQSGKSEPMIEICACNHLNQLTKSELIQHVINCKSKIRVPISSVQVQNEHQPQTFKNDRKIKIRSRL